MALHRSVILRRGRRAALNTRAATARPIPAAALVLCVLLNALPVGSVFIAHCAMPCCQGLDGMGVECAGGSCPIKPPGRAGSLPKRAEPDPMCGAGHASPGEQAQEQSAPAHGDSSPHAPAHGHARAGLEHDHGADASPPDPPRPPALGRARVSASCLPDCAAAPSPFTYLRRARDVGALSHTIRPRPPTEETPGRAAPSAVTLASELRRRFPPRGSPFESHSRLA